MYDWLFKEFDAVQPKHNQPYNDEETLINLCFGCVYMTAHRYSYKKKNNATNKKRNLARVATIK